MQRGNKQQAGTPECAALLVDTRERSAASPGRGSLFITFVAVARIGVEPSGSTGPGKSVLVSTSTRRYS